MTTDGAPTPEALATLFRERLNLIVEDFDEDLLDSGTLDSLALVDLMFHIEQAWGVTVDVLELDIEEFRSLRSIAAYITREQASGG